MRRIGSVFPPLFVAFALTQIAAQVSFAPEVKHAVRGGAFSAATADFDDDVNDDLAIADENLSVFDGYVSIYRGWGNGVFSLWGDTSVGDHRIDVAVGDFDAMAGRTS